MAHWQRWKKKSPVPMDAPISKRLNHQGNLNGRWKGGQIIDYTHKRVLVYSPGHPNPTANGTHVYRYRLVMEKQLGRFLKKGEIVHHKNGDTEDDSITNLELMTQSDHAKKHYINGKFSHATRDLYGY